MTKIVSVSIILVSALIITGCGKEITSEDDSNIDDYESCVAAGNPIMESYPPQCETPDGRKFTGPRD